MLTRLTRWFESRVDPVAPPDRGTPPAGLAAFYWHFVGEHKGLFAALLATGLAVAMVDSLIPVFIGKLVGLRAATDRAAALDSAWPMLIGMALFLAIGRPLVNLLDMLIRVSTECWSAGSSLAASRAVGASRAIRPQSRRESAMGKISPASV